MRGMLAAIEDWVTRDHDEKMRIWYTYLANISKKVGGIKGIKTTVRDPESLNNRSPVLIVSWDPEQLNITGPDVAEILATTKPRIAVHSGYGEQDGSTSIRIVAGQMQPGNDRVVADRIYEILNKKYPKPAPMATPIADLSGRWTVDIEYYSSKSQHTFIIEQDGNWIQGSHKTDFSLREMAGTIEGDQIRLFSSERMIADNVPFTFSGKYANEIISEEKFTWANIKGLTLRRNATIQGITPTGKIPERSAAGNIISLNMICHGTNVHLKLFYCIKLLTERI